MILRAIHESDAQIYLALLHALDTEHDYMSVTPSERIADDKHTRRRIAAVTREPNSTILLALSPDEHEAYGYLACYGGKHERNRHRAAIAVAIRAGYRRRGIASQLFDALWQWAPAAGLRRIEVDVIEANTPAVNLYRSQGFMSEGVRWDSICIDGHLYHEIRMARILRESEATAWHEKANAAAA
jgi:ribosomal protein S18 acetylase RimI-like enzyme